METCRSAAHNAACRSQTFIGRRLAAMSPCRLHPIASNEGTRAVFAASDFFQRSAEVCIRYLTVQPTVRRYCLPALLGA